MNYSDKIIDVSNIGFTFCALYVFNKVIYKVSFFVVVELLLLDMINPWRKQKQKTKWPLKWMYA